MSVFIFAALSLALRYPASLEASIADIARTASGRVGVAVALLETGETVSVHGNDRYPMQSVYKLPIAMAVLDRVDRGRLALTRRVLVQKSDLVPAPVGHRSLRARRRSECVTLIASRSPPPRP